MLFDTTICPSCRHVGSARSTTSHHSTEDYKERYKRKKKEWAEKLAGVMQERDVALTNAQMSGDRMKKQVASLTKECQEQLQKASVEYTEKIRGLEEQVRLLEKKKQDETRYLLEKVHGLERQQDDHQKENQALRQRLADLEDQPQVVLTTVDADKRRSRHGDDESAKKIELLEGQVEMLKKEKQDAEAQIVELNRHLLDITADSDKCTAQVQHFERETEDGAMRFRTLQADNVNLRQRLIELEGRIILRDQEKQSLGAERDELARANEELHRRITENDTKEREEMRNALREECRRQVDDLNKGATSRFETLEADNINLRQRLIELEDLIILRDQEKQSLGAERDELVRANEELRHRITKDGEEMKRLQGEMTRKIQEIEANNILPAEDIVRDTIQRLHSRSDAVEDLLNEIGSSIETFLNDEE